MAHQVFLETPAGDRIIGPAGENVAIRSLRSSTLLGSYGERVLKALDQQCLANITVTTAPSGLLDIDPPPPGGPVQNYVFSVKLNSIPTEVTNVTLTITWVGTGMPMMPPCGTNTETHTINFELLPPGVTASQFPNSGDMPDDPVNSLTGELYLYELPDLFLGGPLPMVFARYYSAMLGTDGNTQSALGNNWLHNYDWSLIDRGASAEVVTNQGRVLHFLSNFGAFSLEHPSDIPYQLIQNGPDRIFGDPRTKLLYTFDSNGRLAEISDGKGNTHSLTYAAGKLDQVSDGIGRTLTFTYDVNDMLASVTDGTRTVSFDYTGGNLTSFTDARGNVTTYAYDTLHAIEGLLTARTRPETNTPLSQTYDLDGRVATQTDAFGNAVTLNYAGTTTTANYPLAASRVHEHTADGELIDSQDEDAQSITATYNTAGQRTGVTDRLGDTTSFSYHAPSGGLDSVTNTDNDTTSYSYTARVASGITFYDLTGIDYPDGTSESFDYDANGNITRHVDRAGEEWLYTYNAVGQLLTGTNPAGGVTAFTYNADGTVASSEDNDNNVTTYSYDGLFRLVTVTYPDTLTKTYTYDENDNVLTIKDERNNTTTLTYDLNNNLESITDTNGDPYMFVYDAMDRLAQTVDPRGNPAIRTYDERQRLKTITDRGGNTMTFDYDGLGRLSAVTDGAGETWMRSYDVESVINSITNPLMNTTAFASDDMGRVSQITTPLLNVKSMAYDNMGRMTSVQNPEGETTVLNFDVRGQLIGIQLHGGAVTASYTRDSLGRVTQVTDPDGQAWMRGFDQQGRITSTTDPNGNNATYQYDNRSRIDQTVYPGALGTLDLTYDGVGNITRRLFSDGTDLNFAYDPMNRLTAADGISLTYDENGDITDSNGITITRNSGGRIETITLAVGKVVTYSYDARDLVEQITDWLGGTTTLQYDAGGRLTGIDRPNAVNTTYTYDDDDRVIGIAEAGVSDISLTRDGAGRIVSASRQIPTPAGVATTSVTSLSYDASSQPTGAGHDAMGRLTDDADRQFGWNLASRLTDVTTPAGTTTFTYDGMGNRLSRTADGTTRDYVWNYATGLPAINIERDTSVDQRYHVTTPGGMLLYTIDAGSNERTDYHYDEMGNTLFLSDSSGMVTASYAYSPYGERLSSKGDADNHFAWQGQFGLQTEPRSDIVYMRARYYDAEKGRFLSRDPVRSMYPKIINPYAYAAGNPLQYIDPLGTRIVETDRPFLDGFSPPSFRGTSCSAPDDGTDPRDVANECPPIGPPTVLIFTQMGDKNTPTFIRQRDHFSAQLIKRGYKVCICDAQQISDRAIVGNDLGISETDLRNTRGIITIGHSSEAQVASFNESSLEAVMDAVGRRGDGTGKIEFLGLWGCKSSKFYDRNRDRLAPYLDENAAIFGFSTWEVGPKFTGFGNRLNPFGSDPLFDYLDRPVDAQLGGEFSVIDPLGYLFGDLLMESL